MTVIEKPAAPRTPEPEQSDGGRTLGSLIFFGMTALLIALVASLLVIGVIGLLDDDDGGASASAGAVATTVDVTLSEFAIDGTLTAETGDVTLSVTNAGTQQHNLVVEELAVETPMLNAGDAAELALGTLDTGNYTVFCSVPGHRDSGMESTLVVGRQESTGEAASGGVHGAGHDPNAYDAEAMDKIMMDSMKAFPVEQEVRGNQILEPKILADGTKEFELTAAITKWEVPSRRDRRRVGLQRHGARPDHQGRRRRQGEGHLQQRHAARLRHPLARPAGPRTIRTACRRTRRNRCRAVTASSTSSPSTLRRSPCTTPTCTARSRCPNGMFARVPRRGEPDPLRPDDLGHHDSRGSSSPPWTSRWCSTTPA